MELLTEELKRQLPPLDAIRHADDPIVHVVFYMPLMDWTWYLMEFDGRGQFYGLEEGDQVKWGMFSLWELQQLRGPFGVEIQRDLDFTPTPLSEIPPRYEYDE